MPAVVAVAGAGIEQGVAAEYGRVIGARQQTDVAHRMARRIQNFQFYSLADLDHVTSIQTSIHVGDRSAGIGMGNDTGAGGRHHRAITADVVAVLMGVQDLGDVPAHGLGFSETLLMIERIHGQCLTGFWARHKVIEISPGVCRPDLLNNHGRVLGLERAS